MTLFFLTGGGGTSFPKARMLGGAGTQVDARKGALCFFYDLLEDGNTDVLSLHSGMPVLEGEKWVAPLWIWEPSRSGRPHPLGDLSERGRRRAAVAVEGGGGGGGRGSGRSDGRAEL